MIKVNNFTAKLSGTPYIIQNKTQHVLNTTTN